jgi:hypothetical protein
VERRQVLLDSGMLLLCLSHLIKSQFKAPSTLACVRRAPNPLPHSWSHSPPPVSSAWSLHYSMTTMFWNEDLQRTDIKSRPFSQAESDAAKAAARQYTEVRRGWG